MTLFAETPVERLMTASNAGIALVVWLLGAVIAVIWTRSRMQWQEAEYTRLAGRLTALQQEAHERRSVVEDQLVNGILSWVAVLSLALSTSYWKRVFPS